MIVLTGMVRVKVGKKKKGQPLIKLTILFTIVISAKPSRFTLYVLRSVFHTLFLPQRQKCHRNRRKQNKHQRWRGCLGKKCLGNITPDRRRQRAVA